MAGTGYGCCPVRTAGSSAEFPCRRTSTTRRTYAGSLRPPRYGPGRERAVGFSQKTVERDGLRRLRNSTALGKVTIPARRYGGQDRARLRGGRRASEKRWNTRARPPPSSRRVASVSSSAARVWMTTGNPVRGRRTHARNTPAERPAAVIVIVNPISPTRVAGVLAISAPDNVRGPLQRPRVRAPCAEWTPIIARLRPQRQHAFGETLPARCRPRESRARARGRPLSSDRRRRRGRWRTSGPPDGNESRSPNACSGRRRVLK